MMGGLGCAHITNRSCACAAAASTSSRSEDIRKLREDVDAAAAEVGAVDHLQGGAVGARADPDLAELLGTDLAELVAGALAAERAPRPQEDVLEATLNQRVTAHESWRVLRQHVVLFSTFLAAAAPTVLSAIDATDGVAARTARSCNYVLFRLMGPDSKRIAIPKTSWDVPALEMLTGLPSHPRVTLLNSAFNPASLLPFMVRAFHKLGPKFLKLAAQDADHFRARIFQKMLHPKIASTFDTTAIIRQAENLAKTAQDLEADSKKICAALREYPDRFECALGMDLMRDPVRLPCGQVLDRAFVVGHLRRAGATDPFTRQPLTEGDLVPEVELRAEIDAWVKEKLEGFES